MTHTMSAFVAAVGLCAATAFSQIHSPQLHSPQTAAAIVDPDGAMARPIEQTWTHPRTAITAAIDLASSSLLAAAPPTAGFVSTDDAPDGDMPRELAWTPDGRFALLVNRDTDNVTWLDVASRTIVATVGVGDFPTHIAISPNGQLAVVTNLGDDTVSVLSVAARSVLATVPITGQQPYRVEITPDSRSAVVGVINNATASTLSIVDLQTFAEVRTIPTVPQGAIGGFATPETGIFGNLFTQFAVAADGRTAIVPDRGNSQIGLYDVVAGVQLALLPAAAQPTSVDIEPSGALAVVAHEGNARTLTVLDITTRTVLATLTTAQDLVNQVVRFDQAATVVMAAVQNALVIVDVASGATLATLSTGTVGDIEVSFDGRFAFVSNFNARVIDIATRSIVATIPFEAGNEAAMSPVAHRAIQLNNRFRENAILFDTNGSASALLGAVQSGPPAEGDASRGLAISPDGRTLIAANIVSGNVTILDAASRTVRAHVPTGDRCWAAAVTPDGRHAVVTNTDASTVSIVDLSTDTEVANLSVPTRPTEVVISPDSTTAYVTTIAGTDRLAILDINGAASAVTGSVPIGQLGTIGYTYSVSSGIELSPDGATLAVCVSFDDQLKLVDTATRAVVATVPVGDFPIRVAFSPDGTLAYVTHAFSDDLRVVAIAGGASTVVATVPGIEFPLQVDLDAVGRYSYVGSFDFATPSLEVVDNTTFAIVATVPLASPPRSAHYSPSDGVLYVTLTGGDLVRVRAAGPASAVIDSVPLLDSPADLAFSESLRVAFTAQPGARDGVDVIEYGGIFVAYGSGTAGTGGLVPSIAGSGVPAIGESVTVSTSQGRASAMGTYLVGLVQTSFPLFGGTILVAPFVDAPHALDAAGGFVLPLTLGNDPGLIGVDVFFQGLYVDPQAPGGLAMTRGLAMRIR